MWSRIEFFLLSDDDARWRAIGWIIFAVGTCGSIDLALLNSSVDDGILLMGLLALILSIMWIGWYCLFGGLRSPAEQPSLISRRTLLFQAGVFVAFLLTLRLPRAEAKEAARKLLQAADNPLDPEKAEIAQRTLAAAKEGRLRIDSMIVRNTGTRFIEMAQQGSAAWAAAQEYLSYRSFLNADFVPKLTPATGTSRYRPAVNITDMPTKPGTQRAFSVSFAGGYASGDQAARLELLSDPQPEGSEFAYFIIDGGEAAIRLDDAFMRNVIIRNSDISYSGSKVRLENVWFINCTFQSYTRVLPETKRLGATIVAYSRPITLRIKV